MPISPSANGATITVVLPATRPTRPAPQCLPPRPEVLIVAGQDGHIEVYTNRPMRVHVAQRLDEDSADPATVDDYLDATLPKWARDLHFPWNLAGCYTVRPRTAREELGRRLWLDLIHQAKELSRV